MLVLYVFWSSRMFWTLTLSPAGFKKRSKSKPPAATRKLNPNTPTYPMQACKLQGHNLLLVLFLEFLLFLVCLLIFSLLLLHTTSTKYTTYILSSLLLTYYFYNVKKFCYSPDTPSKPRTPKCFNSPRHAKGRLQRVLQAQERFL